MVQGRVLHNNRLLREAFRLPWCLIRWYGLGSHHSLHRLRDLEQVSRA